MNHPRRDSKNRKSEAGFSLLELLIAMTILAIGFGGLSVLFFDAIATNKKSSHDSSATMLAQLVLEQISAQPANTSASTLPPGASPNIAVTDCAGNVLTINPLGAPVPTGAGATLTANGNIDQFTTPPAGYQMIYVACAPAGSGMQSSYDVRWNVMTITSTSRLITVSARQVGGGGGLHFAIPVTLRTVGGI